jgi:iron complex transport system permease protein
VRFCYIALAAFLSASAVSVAGLLGFVGLIIPHVVRLLVGSDHKFLLPFSALLGAAIIIIADTVARTIFNPVEIPVGVIMAFLGAPFFLYLLRGKLRGRH